MNPLPEANAAERGSPRATAARPKFVPLAGIWLVCALQVSLLLLGITLILSNVVPPVGADWFSVPNVGARSDLPVSGQRAVEFVSLLVAIGLVAMNVAMLWKATARYRAGRRTVRRRRLGLCEQCGYDLRGTIAADRDTCPECGATRQVGAPSGAPDPHLSAQTTVK